jgi:hypothetical protein
VQPLVRRPLAEVLRIGKKLEDESLVHWAGDEQ